MEKHIQRYNELCFDRPYLAGRETAPRQFALLVVYADPVFNRTRAEISTAWSLGELEPKVIDAYKAGAVETIIMSLWTGRHYAADLTVRFQQREPAAA